MSLTRKEKAPMQEHQGCRAIRLNFRIQSRSSCASAELYPARESPPILPPPVNLSIPPPHYSHFDPTIPLILIRPQQHFAAVARSRGYLNFCGDRCSRAISAVPSGLEVLMSTRSQA